MILLHVDTETFSTPELKSAGLEPYAKEVEELWISFTFNNEPVFKVDLYNDPLPRRVWDALLDPTVLKLAWNCPFEIETLQAYYDIKLDRSQWQCVMVAAAYLGLPLKMETCAKVLGLEQQKDSRGSALIKYFSVPIKKPIAKNGFRVRNLPHHDWTAWQEFGDYCAQDTEVERAIYNKIKWFPISAFERELWILDQKINERGVLIDIPFVEMAVKLNFQHREKLIDYCNDLTGLTNSNSVKQLKDWLLEETGVEYKSLSKKIIPDILKHCDSEIVKEVLDIRAELSKSSVAKYTAMLKGVSSDGRLRWLFQFYGANRTGRFAARRVQPHNLKRSHFKDDQPPRIAVMTGDSEWIDLLFGGISSVLSALIRSSFIASPGKKLYPCDLAAIEARIISWLAGETWRLDIFATHGKIYEASASKMFKVPFEEVTEGSKYRDMGKIAELALGYQGGVGALLKFGALDMGLTEPELLPIVKLWRSENKRIVNLWYSTERAAKECLRTRSKVRVTKGVYFDFRNGYMFMVLPSGRRLSYYGAHLSSDDSIVYYGLNDKGVWSKVDSYGGKLVENMVQAIARDILAHGMINVDKAGYTIVLHVHDELVCEEDWADVAEIERLMTIVPDWAEGLPLKAKGFETLHYRK